MTLPASKHPILFKFCFRIIYAILILLSFGESLWAQPGQCLGGGCNVGNARLGTQTTTSNAFVNAVGGTFGGEYNTYNVTAGQQYEWSLCTADGAVNPSADMTLTLTNDITNAIICYSDDVCGLQPKILWTATFTGIVRVYLHELGCLTNTNSHTVRWRCVSCGPPPGCSTCANPTPITTLPFSGTYTTCGACNSVVSGQGCTSLYLGGEDYLFSFTPTNTGSYSISLTGTLTYTGVFVTQGCPTAGGTCITSNTNSAGNPSINSVSLTAGVTYYIVVDTWPSPACTPFTINVSSSTPTNNDLICNASPIACGQTLNGTTINATLTGTGEGVACGGTATQPGVWYVVAGTGQIMTASLCGTAWDSRIQVFSGANCNTITCVGGNDDNGPACLTSSASYQWTSVAGTNYYIFVSGFSSPSAFTISLNCSAPPTPPNNDLICNAAPIACGQTLNGTTINATSNGTGEGLNCGGFTQSQPGVWYSYVGTGATVNASLCATAWDSRIQVFTGANCNTVNCVGGNDNNGPLCAGNAASYSWLAANGQTYYILISGVSSTAAFTLGLACQTPCAANCNNGPPPSNDACSGAQNLGAIPTPQQCPNGIGTVAAFNLNNLCATAEPNYTSLLSCIPSGNQATPAADVWYRFTIVAPILNITINGLGIPNVALYEGTNCANLVPRGCAIGGAGVLNAQFQGLAPGTYYLQVSGGDVLDRCNFSLTLQNNYDCAGCVLAANLDATPPPVNGQYQPNTQVTFCYSLTSYQQTSANWLHGIIPTFGLGWDLSTFTPLTTTTVGGATANTCAGNGTWSWYNTNITSSATGAVTGPGFYYETAAGNASFSVDGNPGNNYGDSNPGNCTWNFCWSIKTKPLAQCVQDQSLNMSVNTTGDGESGSWTSLACTQDPVLAFFAQSNCCPTPNVAVTNATCALPGSATGQGLGTGPWTYVWQNSAGVTLQTNANTAGTSTITGLAAGDYILTVTDATLCTSFVAFSIAGVQNQTVSAASSNPTLCINTPLTPITFTTTGATGIGAPINLPAGLNASWAANVITISGTPTATGSFNYSIPLTGGCGNVSASGTITVTNINTAGIPSANPTLCVNNVIAPSITIATVGATGIGNPIGLPAGVNAVWAGNIITISGTPSDAGTFNYSIPLAGGCGAVSATGSFVVNPAPTVTANALSFDVCAGPTAADQSSPGITLNSPQAGTIFNWSLYSGTTPTGVPNQTGSGIPAVPFTNNTCTDQNYVYQVTPILNGCPGIPINIAVRVRPKPTSSFTISPSPACSNQTATVTYTGVSCPGSTYNWTWPAGVTVVSGSGSGPIVISFAASGTYPIKLSVISPSAVGSCTSTQTTVNISVNLATTPSFNPVGPFCSGESISALPTTSINGITGTWSPAISNTATTTYTFTPTAGQCATTAQLTITINPNLTPTFNYTNQTLCQNAIISLPILNQTSNNGISGIWNPVSINTSITGPTTYTFTPNAGQCATSYQFITTIVPEANAGTGTTLNLCSSAAPINLFNSLGGTPQTTGVWTGPSVLGNGYLGTFDPATQVAGTYTYTVSGTNPCPNAVSTITINLSANPSASFLYPGAPFCINQAGSISPVLNGTAGGSYSASPAGLSITAGGSITPSSSAAGTYTVVYSIAANGSCPAFVTQNSVTIIAPPGIPTLIPNPICAGNSITLTGGNAAWYEFTINGIQVQAPSADNTYVAPTLSAGDQVCIIGHPLPPFAFNGQITEAEWGSPLAISTGGPPSGFGAGNNLDAIYLKNTSGYLFGAVAGQTQNNSNNRILLFIDCEVGGYNSLAGWINRTNAPYYSVENLSSSIQFDAGFEPDYILAMNQASATGYFDLYRMSSNVNVFIGQTGVNPLLGYQNNGGQGIFNAGYEFAIPMSNLNNPTGSIKVFAMMVNDPGLGPPTFISNQFLTPAGAGESNYGSGAVNFGLAQPNPISYSLAAACTSQTCITVNPTPIANVTGDNAVCSGESTALSLNSTLGGTTFSWTASQITASGASNGNGSAINQTLTTTTGGTVNYTITPSLGGCQGTPINTTVTISPTPTLTPIFHE